MRLYDAIGLGTSDASAQQGADLVHAAFERYENWTRKTNTEHDQVRFLLAPAQMYGAFLWPLNSVVKHCTYGKLGVVVGYCNGVHGWLVKVKFADGVEELEYNLIKDAQIPAEIVEIAVGSRDQLKERVVEKVEEAFA